LVPHVTFVHGIGNKVEAGPLERSWVDALRDGSGPDLRAEDVSTSMCYWADVLYASPLPDIPAVGEAGEEADIMASEVITEPWFRELPPAEQREVLDLAAEVGALSWLREPGEVSGNGAWDERDGEPDRADALDATVRVESIDFERVPLPGPVRKRLMETFLRDVHHYLWNVEFRPTPGKSFKVRTEVRRRTLDALAVAADVSRPHIVVGHSLGSVIAYDVLQNVAGAPEVDALITVGSPLGLDEVQDRLDPGWSRWDGFPDGRLRGRWVNVYDRLDPVCGFDPNLANDFRKAGRAVVTDIHERNWGRWRHSIGKYLRRPLLRKAFVELLEF
jgi:hypothetical protein